MGLGGYLTWTAAATEIKKIVGDVKFLPIEQHGPYVKLIQSEVFSHNRNFISSLDANNPTVFPLVLNNPAANYCKQDTQFRAIQRGDKHIIEQICEVYGIANPVLRCYLDFSDEETQKIESIVKENIGDEDFITIEPVSKDNYTPNRAYSFDKWQSIVDSINDKIKVVQVGHASSRKLSGALDLTGKTTFFEAAGVIGRSKLFLSSEGGLVHAATAVETQSIVILTGYQTRKMVEYPQNINIDISTHGPCGLKQTCLDCKSDVENHDWKKVVDKVYERFAWKI